MTVRSQWRQEAVRIIMDTLALLPEDATDQAKRQAVRDAYPWGSRENHPYRMWCQAVRGILGPRPRRREPKSPGVPVGIPPDLAGMVLALQSDPADEAAQRALCDWLEDAGDGRAAQARRCLLRTYPGAEEVAKVMYPRGQAVSHTEGANVILFHAHDGSGYKFPLSRIADQLAGRTLLVDPAVEQAARAVRGLALIQLVLGGRS